MTARFTAQLVVLLLTLFLFVGCGGDGAPEEDPVPSTSDSSTSGGGDESARPGADDEFGAAPPVSVDAMEPLGAADPVASDGVFDSSQTPDGEFAVGPVGPDVLTPAEGERYPDLFEEARAATSDEPSDADDGEEGFMAAPPVAVTDAAGPIPGLEEPAAVEPAAIELTAPDTTEVRPAAVELPAVEASYWPRFHGPNGDNKSPDKGLLQKWPEGGPELMWSANGIGQGYSSITLADGLIFTAGSKGTGTGRACDDSRRRKTGRQPALGVIESLDFRRNNT